MNEIRDILAEYRDELERLRASPSQILDEYSSPVAHAAADEKMDRIVLLRRRVEQVLRRRHGDRHSHSQPDQPTERLAAAIGPSGAEDFVEALSTLADGGLDFGEAVNQALDVLKVGAGIREAVLEAMERK